MASETGLSRRDLMKKGAVAGAIVWSAPLLTSTPAFAASGKCGGSKPCTTFYFMKWGPGGESCTDTHDGNGTGCTNYSAAQLKCPGTTVPAVANGCSFVTTTWSGTAATITYDSGVVPLKLQLKYGSACVEFNYDENSKQFTPSSYTEGACSIQVVTATVDGKISATATHSGCNDFSHANTYFCR